ncbi:MAG: MFS transporter [Pseudomonadota bacterium]|nr:MFS transporter [Pseudomonadota bacterium]
MVRTAKRAFINPFILGWLMFFLTSFFYFYDFILRMIPSVMMDNILQLYNVDADMYAFYESSFYVTYTPLQLFAGPLIDEIGVRKIFPLAVLCCLIGALVSALQPYFSFLIIARMLIGLGSSFAFVMVLKISNEWLPAYYYPFIAGLTTTLGMIGGIVSEVVLPDFIQYGVPNMYFFLAFFAAVLIILSYFCIFDKEDHEITSVLDIRLIYDIYTVFSTRQFILIGVIGCLLFTPVQLFVVWAQPFFAQTLSISKHDAGHIASMLFWGIATGAPFFGWLASQIQNKRILLIIGSLLSAMCLITILFYPNLTPWQVSVLMYGLGFFKSCQPLVFVSAKNLVSPHLTATAVAGTNMIVNLSSFFQPVIGYQLSRYHRLYEHGMSNYTLLNWQLALSVIPVFLLVACFLSFFLKLDSDEIDYANPVTNNALSN